MKRRTFLACAAAVGAATAVPWMVHGVGQKLGDVRIAPARPRRAAVLWFSQTGHTRRVGRLLARLWEQQGLEVAASDYRAFDGATLPGFDLLAVGSPVNYFEAPAHVRAWLEALPPLPNARAAAWVTFGGEGGNVFNAAAGLLACLAERGAAPVGLEAFGNMSAFAPTWSLGNEARILAFRHLPDAGTWAAVRRFGDDVLGRARSGTGVVVSREWNPRELVKGAASVEGTKLMIGSHGVDAATCAGCDTCVRGCPVGAIQPTTRVVHTSRCVACLGCVNTCPVGAMTMTFLGKPVTGFPAFLKRHGIAIAEPPELTPA